MRRARVFDMQVIYKRPSPDIIFDAKDYRQTQRLTIRYIFDSS